MEVAEVVAATDTVEAVDETPRQAFTMDPNLLVSVIRSQAGTLTKALLEGVMNSIDAGATRVDIKLTKEAFAIEDNGRGFADQEEIRVWFGRFGTPHAAGDATYGRFRMGRGQMFSHAATVWTSNEFQMSVDLNKDGLTYALKQAPQPFRGCRIEGRLYEPLTEMELTETLTELRKFVAFTPRPVYVNGTLFGATPARLKTWTLETQDAWIRLNAEADELAIYNQGVFVCSMSTGKVGMGGVVVSKRPLEVNFARNAVMERTCLVWRRIRDKLEGLVFEKLARAQKLSDGERTFLARRVHTMPLESRMLLQEAKVLTEPGGKHVPLSSLRNVRTLVYMAQASPEACQVHGADVFVVTDKLIERFGTYSFEGFVERLQEVPNLLRSDVRVEAAQRVMADLGIGQTTALTENALTKRQQAAFKALQQMNESLGSTLRAAGRTERTRTLLVASQKKESAVAWTDGRTYITVNVRHLSEFERGLDGVQRWVYTLLHEYMHDTDDSESHDHGEVFYHKFHESLFDKTVGTGARARDGLLAYLAALKELGVARSRKLSSELQKTMPR